MLIMVSIKQLAKQWYLKVGRSKVLVCREKMSRLMRFISVSNQNWILRVGRICCQVTRLACRFPACSWIDANLQLGSRKSCLFYYYLLQFKSFFLMSWFVLLSILFVIVTCSLIITDKEHYHIICLWALTYHNILSLLRFVWTRSSRLLRFRIYVTRWQ